MIVVRLGEPAEISFNADDLELGMSSVGIGGGATRRASGHDAVLTRKADGQSQAILQCSMQQKRFGAASINWGRDPSFTRRNPTDIDGSAMDGALTLVCYTLKDVTISSYSASGAGTETIGLLFKDMKAAYFREPAAE